MAPDRVRFSWLLEGTGTGRAQRAYQVLVTGRRRTRRRGTAAGWSPQASADVAYGGPPLAAGGRYRWKVQVWDETGRASGWSDPARFEVELDQTSGWHASWIGPGPVREAVIPPSGAGPVDPVARALTPAPYLRRAFTVDQPVTSARLYVTALGLYEARLNGRRVGDGFLTPGWTDYAPADRLPDLRRDRAAAPRAITSSARSWPTGGTPASSASTPSGPAPTTAWHPSCWPSWCCGWPTAASSGSSPTGSGESSAGAIRHADLLMGERHDLDARAARLGRPRLRRS